jgi:acetyltransferase-like isoleucine patch superfamily enzyme
VAIDLVDKGERNTVQLHPWFETFGKIRIEFRGNDSHVKILSIPRSCNGTIIQLGSRSTVEVGEQCGLSNTFIAGADDCHVRIGAFTTFTARARFIMHEPSTVELGRDCMIASDVQFMTSDVHTIFDLASHRRINTAKSISIGEHVWISLQCFIMKGASIGSGSVIGLRSTVTGTIPDNCVAVGSPCRVLRQGSGWDRRLWVGSDPPN